MPRRGKKYRAAAEKIDPLKQYPPEEGVGLVKETAFTRFDSSVELHIRTGLDPKHADQQVRGSAVLPAGTGRTQRVVAFAQGDKAREAEAAGADIVGAEELVTRIQGGWTDFDVAVATPDMMGMVGRLGRVLGPRGLMPNPRSGTVTPEIGRAIREIKGGRVEFRVDRTGVIHAPIGKVSFDEEKILQNLGALVDAVVRAKPAGAKGTYLKTFNIASTMGPSIELDNALTLALASSET
jgi:large subunit ribosomal protein L1